MPRGERSRWRPRRRRDRQDEPVPVPTEEFEATPEPPEPVVPMERPVADLPQFESSPSQARIAVVTSTFHSVRLPDWIHAIHPNRLGALDHAPSLVIVDASAAGPASAWSGLGWGDVATIDALLTTIERLDAVDVPTAFRWDTTGPDSHLDVFTAACRHLLAWPGVGLTVPAIDHAIDENLFHPPSEVAPDSDRLITDSPVAPDRLLDDALLYDPVRLAGVFRQTRRLIIERPSSPLLRAVAAEAVACGVEVEGVEPLPAASWTDVAAQYAEATGVTILLDQVTT